ncbi:unnamed protein product [Owenia fusiformis]|uniref:non-specific serine/threonine protein kinase n=1 Tax=Owenia fusiformis TaxID=6347 RepID=A0A8S4N2I1_OWEFU|nr:unnamed protein product [Owenia fusiformis]
MSVICRHDRTPKVVKNIIHRTIKDKNVFNTPTKNENRRPRKLSIYSPAVKLPQIERVINVLQFSDIEIKKCLGSGGFGSVYEGFIKGTRVAVKRLHAVTKNPKARDESFKAELHTINLKHPNVVQTLSASSTDTFIVMEFAGDRNLQQIINNPDEHISEKAMLAYSLDLAKAMEFTHENHIVHLDIKPANIIVTPKGICKLCDFGCCQKVEIDTGIVSPTKRSYLTGTFAYRAPELLKGEAPTFKADVYGYGITLWQINSRDTPYSGQNQHVVIFGVVSLNVRPKPPVIDHSASPVQSLYQGLYQECWVAKPEERPTSKDIVDTLEIWREYY